MLHTNGMAPLAQANGVKHPDLQRISSLEPDGPDANTDMCNSATRRYAAQLKTDPQLAGAALDCEAKDHLRKCYERGDTINQLVESVCRVYASRKALGSAVGDAAKFSYITYAQIWERIQTLASGAPRRPARRSPPGLRPVTAPGRSALVARVCQREHGVSAMQLHVVELHVGKRCWADRARARCRVCCGGGDEAGRLLRHLRLCQHRLDKLRDKHAVPGCGRHGRVALQAVSLLHRRGRRRSPSPGVCARVPCAMQVETLVHASRVPSKKGQALRHPCRTVTHAGPAPLAMHAGTACRARRRRPRRRRMAAFSASTGGALSRARRPGPGGVNVALPTNITAEDVAKVINEAELVGMACSVDELATLAPVLGACHTLRTFVVMEHEGCANPKLPALVKQARRPPVDVRRPRRRAAVLEKAAVDAAVCKRRGSALIKHVAARSASPGRLHECCGVPVCGNISAAKHACDRAGRFARVSTRVGQCKQPLCPALQRPPSLPRPQGRRGGTLQGLVRHGGCPQPPEKSGSAAGGGGSARGLPAADAGRRGQARQGRPGRADVHRGQGWRPRGPHNQPVLHQRLHGPAQGRHVHRAHVEAQLVCAPRCAPRLPCAGRRLLWQGGAPRERFLPPAACKF